MINAEHPRNELPVPFESASISDAMSHGVLSCPPETPLRVVARMMATHGVHAIFVFEHTDEDDEAPQLWAVVSDLDLVAATPLDLDELTAGETAVTPLVSVGADHSIAEAGSLMANTGSLTSPSPIRLPSPDRCRIDARHRPGNRGRSRSRRSFRLCLRRAPAVSEKPAGLRRDHQLFARRDDLDPEVAEEADAVDYPITDVLGVLADTAGEGEGVDTAAGGCHGSDGSCHTVDEHVESQLRRLPHVSDSPSRQAGEPRLVLQPLLELFSVSSRSRSR